MLITGNNNTLLRRFLTAIASRFSLKDLRDMSFFLGVEATRNSRGFHLMQKKYVIDLLKRTNMLDAHPVSSPMTPTPKLSLKSGTPLINPSEYRMVLCSLQYLAFTRPDIAYVVNRLSQFMHKPTDIPWQAVKRILRYLAGTPAHGILIRANSPTTLHAYSDAYWAGDIDDYLSTTAYVVYFGGNPISWSSKKQKDIPVIYCDNIGATHLAANPVFHSRMKHIALDFHFIRDNVQSGALRVTHLSTRDQLADALTKPLTSIQFTEIMHKIGVTQVPPS
ncbi:PREDICTED: uncharacterized mitochondrial protein AtMg00810-like [Brassica oleracea var. oleracea]|uniref:uncharacterized mitochondrial protein AtMg00810-like n=1 Tax=Brassica oleracea var. oleracea TaxID=109376 RepID=UPI0006A6B6A2|nr:PREDICTED: uncharacterized mitochondrial protein AtMg00810-like [Brassica oleracea var. oleracea]